MAANVSVVGIYEQDDGKVTELAEQRYSTIDQPNANLSYPNNIPSSSTPNYSYWIHTGLKIKQSTSTSDKYSKLTNFRWRPGSFKTVWGLKDGMVVVALKKNTNIDPGCPHGEYDQARGYPGDTGFSIMDAKKGHKYYKDDGECIDTEAYINSPIVFDKTEYTDTSRDHLTKFLVTQLVVAQNTDFGEKEKIQCDIIWSEI